MSVPHYSRVGPIALKSDLVPFITDADLIGYVTDQELADAVMSTGGGYQYPVTTAIATWTIPNTLGRLVNVTFYLDGIGIVQNTYEQSVGSIVATWPYPVSGYAIIS